MIEERKCTGPCGKWKPRDCYTKDRTRTDGLRGACKECDNERNRKHKREVRASKPKSEPRIAIEKRERIARELLGYMQTYWNVVVNEQPMGSIR